jgi:hypothetical protein
LHTILTVRIEKYDCMAAAEFLSNRRRQQATLKKGSMKSPWLVVIGRGMQGNHPVRGEFRQMTPKSYRKPQEMCVIGSPYSLF